MKGRLSLLARLQSSYLNATKNVNALLQENYLPYFKAEIMFILQNSRQYVTPDA